MNRLFKTLTFSLLILGTQTIDALNFKEYYVECTEISGFKPVDCGPNYIVFKNKIEGLTITIEQDGELTTFTTNQRREDVIRQIIMKKNKIEACFVVEKYNSKNFLECNSDTIESQLYQANINPFN